MFPQKMTLETDQSRVGKYHMDRPSLRLRSAKDDALTNGYFGRVAAKLGHCVLEAEMQQVALDLLKSGRVDVVDH